MKWHVEMQVGDITHTFVVYAETGLRAMELAASRLTENDGDLSIKVTQADRVDAIP